MGKITNIENQPNDEQAAMVKEVESVVFKHLGDEAVFITVAIDPKTVTETGSQIIFFGHGNRDNYTNLVTGAIRSLELMDDIDNSKVVSKQ